MMSTRTLDSDVSGPVEAGEQRGEGQQRADRERAVDGHDAAEAVDHRRRERRDEGEGGHEDRAVEGDLDADVADPTGALGVLGLLTGGRAEELDEQGAGDVEALGHPRAHVGVERHLPVREARRGACP